MNNQQFCLKWNNHHTNLLSEFQKLLTKDFFVDVTLACEGKAIKAHKVLLSACSPFFEDLFLQNPCPHPIVILKDMLYTDLQAILEFIYLGEVNVPQDKLTTFLSAAKVLRVKGLETDESDEKDPPSSGENSSASFILPTSPKDSKLHKRKKRKKSLEENVNHDHLENSHENDDWQRKSSRNSHLPPPRQDSSISPPPSLMESKQSKEPEESALLPFPSSSSINSFHSDPLSDSQEILVVPDSPEPEIKPENSQLALAIQNQTTSQLPYVSEAHTSLVNTSGIDSFQFSDLVETLQEEQPFSLEASLPQVSQQHVPPTSKNGLLRNRQRRRVEGSQRPQCPLCKKVYFNKQVLARHMEIHQKVRKRYACHICHKGYLNLTDLSNHRKTHAEVCRFKCYFCNRAFMYYAARERHIAEVHDFCDKSLALAEGGT